MAPVGTGQVRPGGDLAQPGTRFPLSQSCWREEMGPQLGKIHGNVFALCLSFPLLNLASFSNAFSSDP